ncbi:uncharacterized protein T551_03219 [Pneumocystis jirovecii RU7]|uniref:Mediator of RNA polymerase II transcription subunit 9 n=1 Tax=Pneumocystis jirovecii (strain RU7) TaxID=1408657 RepID=A0A0W4ZFT2_PNEJ7|nr:uncharacterized protein T551_03219 [Pneumocystis jirovecii RU7]KTW27225.1 hypothetical protein T551_03219 [Pneumocystis jirovecii RU7]
MDLSSTNLIPQIIRILQIMKNKEENIKEFNKEISNLHQQISNIRKMLQSLPGKDLSILDQEEIIQGLEKQISIQKKLLAEINVVEQDK